MIDERLQRTEFARGLRGIKAAEGEQDTAGERLGIHSRADDETCAFNVCVLRHRDIDLWTGLLLESAFADVGDDTDDAGGLFPGAVREFSNRVFAGPLATRGRLINDDDRLVGRGVAPREIAA